MLSRYLPEDAFAAVMTAVTCDHMHMLTKDWYMHRLAVVTEECRKSEQPAASTLGDFFFATQLDCTQQDNKDKDNDKDKEFACAAVRDSTTVPTHISDEVGEQHATNDDKDARKCKFSWCNWMEPW